VTAVLGIEGKRFTLEGDLANASYGVRGATFADALPDV
jgi:hypothetical protein